MPARSIASNHGRNEPSRIGGSGPSMRDQQVVELPGVRGGEQMLDGIDRRLAAGQPGAALGRFDLADRRAGICGVPGKVVAPEDDAACRIRRR